MLGAHKKAYRELLSIGKKNIMKTLFYLENHLGWFIDLKNEKLSSRDYFLSPLQIYILFFNFSKKKIFFYHLKISKRRKSFSFLSL